jgi:septal ring factor EnvC (AmiA/AmiB activator)
MKLSLHFVALIAAAIAIALLVDAWHSARHDSEQLAATLKAQNGTIQQAAEQEKQRDSQLSTVLAAIQSQKRAVQPPQTSLRTIIRLPPTTPAAHIHS